MLEDGRLGRLSCAPRTPSQKSLGVFCLCTRRGRGGIKVPLAQVRFLDPCIASMENLKDPVAFCRGMLLHQTCAKEDARKPGTFNGIRVVASISLGSVCLCCVPSMNSHARETHKHLLGSMMPTQLW